MSNSTEICETVFFFQLPSESVIYEWLEAIHDFYSVTELHTHVSVIMCIIGTICNVCNIVVLTRKPMRAPVNMILTAMACCDTVVLFTNLIYTTHYKYVAYENCTPANWSYGWVMFLIAHAHLSLIGHSSSLWLSVMLALLRYMTLRNRTGSVSQKICLRHSYVAIATVIIFITIFNGPNFLIYKIREDRLNESCQVKEERYMDEPAYLPDRSDLANQGNCLLLRLAVWIHGIIFKVVPCILLTVFVCLLVKILNEVKRNRIRLAMNSHCVSDSATASFSNTSHYSIKHSKRPSIAHPHTRTSERTDRTTRMLLAIVIVFLITEVPQGILAILLGVFSDDFRYKIYVKIGDILDLLSLCNSCATFIIYCSMSGQFRAEFKRVFLPFIKLLPPAVAARRSSEAITTRLCYLQPENGNFGRDRSSAAISASNISGHNYCKHNGHAQTNDGTQRPVVVQLQRVDDSAEKAVVAFPVRGVQTTEETVDEKTELLQDSRPSNGDYSPFEKKTGKMLEARYRAT